MMSKRNKPVWQLPFLAVLIVGTVIIVRQQHNAEYRNSRGMIFGTSYNITYQSDSNLDNGIREELQKVDDALSPFNPRSIITAVNENREVALNTMFTEVYDKSMKISEATDGAFDITVAPLVNQWGFGFKSGSFPDKRQIDSIRQFTGYKKVNMRNGKITKTDPRMMLDCSSIAKGYGCDIVARYLRSKGVDNFMVEIGGEIVTSGINPKRLPWKIGVTKPDNDSLNTNGEIQTILNLTDCAMATSGNYRNYYVKDGKKYAHTIDPKTGYPVQHNILSATVIADDCATADAYATAFMVLGLDKSREVLDKHPELMAYFICSSTDGGNSVWFSPALGDRIEKQDKSDNTEQQQ